MANEAKANPVKGEFNLTVGDNCYTLKLTTNELCIAEGILDKKTGDFAPRLGDGDFRQLRTVLWCALQPHHPDMGIDDAGDIITEIGPNRAASELIKGISAAFPPAPTDKGAAKTAARPRVRATATA